MRPYLRETPFALRSGPFSVRRPWQGESEGRPPRRKASTVPTAFRPYDQRQERPANPRNVVGLRPPPWEWSLETDGALALSPKPEEERRTSLKAVGTSASVPRMAQPQAHGLAYRAAERQAMRARVRRARRTAALAVVACVCLVVLLLTAFGSGKTSEATNTGPAPTSRLLPAGPPRAQIIALQDTLRIQLPITRVASQRSATTLRARAHSPSIRSARRRTPVSSSGSSTASSATRARESATTRSAAESARRRAASTSALRH